MSTYAPYIARSIELPHASAAACQIGQIALRLHYQALRNQGELPQFADVEFSCCSQKVRTESCFTFFACSARLIANRSRSMPGAASNATRQT